MLLFFENIQQMKSKIKFWRRFKLRTATLSTSADSPRRELSAGVLNVTERARKVGFTMKSLSISFLHFSILFLLCICVVVVFLLGRRAYLRIQVRMQIFEKVIKIEVPQPRDYEIRNLRKISCRFLGSNPKKVSRKYVLQPEHFSFRILVPMSILAFWTWSKHAYWT